MFLDTLYNNRRQRYKINSKFQNHFQESSRHKINGQIYDNSSTILGRFWWLIKSILALKYSTIFRKDFALKFKIFHISTNRYNYIYISNKHRWRPLRNEAKNQKKIGYVNFVTKNSYICGQYIRKYIVCRFFVQRSNKTKLH